MFINPGRAYDTSRPKKHLVDLFFLFFFPPPPLLFSERSCCGVARYFQTPPCRSISLSLGGVETHEKNLFWEKRKLPLGGQSSCADAHGTSTTIFFIQKRDPEAGLGRLRIEREPRGWFGFIFGKNAKMVVWLDEFLLEIGRGYERICLWRVLHVM